MRPWLIAMSGLALGCPRAMVSVTAQDSGADVRGDQTVEDSVVDTFIEDHLDATIEAVAPTPDRNVGFDAANETSMDSSAFMCDRPTRRVFGEVGVYCYGQRYADRDVGVDFCGPDANCCSINRVLRGLCYQNSETACQRPSVGLFCDGPEDCPNGTVCCRYGEVCVRPEECVAWSVLCHDDADCPCNHPRCCGQLALDDLLHSGFLHTCQATCDGG